MTPLIPDEAELGAMEGEALRHTAWQLTLAPPGTALMYGSYFIRIREGGPLEGQWLRWQPDTRLGQAWAVIEVFEREGWTIQYGWQGDTQEGIIGIAKTLNPDRPMVAKYGYWGGNNPDTKPIALLRCACLARAAQRRESAEGAAS